MTATNTTVEQLVGDVLCEIFGHVRDAYGFSLYYNMIDFFCPVLRLSQVSRDWRAAAFSKASLWADIHLAYVTAEDYPNSDDTPRAIDSNAATRAVEYHLERSRPARLTLDLMSDAWPALDLLLNESDRWRACFVRDIANVDSTPREFPSLEHLRFDHSRGTQYFRRAPALCSYAGLFDEDMDLPWHQLTSVTLEAINNVGPIDIVSALACCTRATFFRAMCTAVSGKQRLVIDAECPSLRRLELVVNDFDFRSKNTRYLLPRVLDCVTAPRLTSLDIERFRKAPWNWSNKSTDALAACLDRSHTALTSLALRNVQITPSQMCRLFKSLPALEQLTWWETVKCHHSDLNMLAAAIGPGTESSECPLPRLAHLEIRGNLQHSVDPQSAARIICYRARNTALRHVVLDYCTLDQAIRDELGELLDSFVVCGRGC